MNEFFLLSLCVGLVWFLRRPKARARTAERDQARERVLRELIAGADWVCTERKVVLTVLGKMDRYLFCREGRTEVFRSPFNVSGINVGDTVRLRRVQPGEYAKAFICEGALLIAERLP